MKKRLAVSLLGLAIFVAACQPTKPPPPPPTPVNPDRDVLLLGDSVGFGVGCELGHNAEEPLNNCPPQPGFSTWNGYLGACSVGEGRILLYNATAIEGNCNGPNHYNPLWGQAVDVVTPDLVVIVTGGWEIVDRWSTLPLNCDPANVFLCSAPDRQMGNTDNATLMQNAVDNYKTEMTNAINLIRSRPSAPKVLLLNSPYVAPEQPSGSPGVWYEAYPEDQPANWQRPNLATPYYSSKDKVDALNQAVEDVVDVNFAGDPDVEWFDFWVEFSPGNEFSFDVCPFPNNKELLSTCPGDEIRVRLDDAGHFTAAGNDLLGQYLLVKVNEMLGI